MFYILFFILQTVLLLLQPRQDHARHSL